MSLTVQCPTCQKQVEWKSESKFKPFCSERCKMIDFGDWASEKHAIPVKPELNISNIDPEDTGFDEADFFKADQ